MVGYKVVVIDCDDNGDIDMSDLETKASEHGKNIAAAIFLPCSDALVSKSDMSISPLSSQSMTTTL